MDSSSLNFKRIPKVLNFSGSSLRSAASSMRTTSVDSTPFSERIHTPLTGTPLSNYTAYDTPRQYKIDYTNSGKQFDSSPGFHRKRKQVNRTYNDTCAFCAEALHNIFEGEKLVDLDCGHSMHLDCLTELVNMPTLGFNSDFQNPASAFSEEILCPECDTSVKVPEDLISHIKQGSGMSTDYEGMSYRTNENHMENIMSSIEAFEMPDSTIFMESSFNLDGNGEYMDTTSDDATDENPITPQSQMGSNFWERDNDNDIIMPLSSDSINTDGLELKNKPTETNVQSSFQNNIELAQVLFAPEFSSVNVDNDQEMLTNVGCVVNIATTEFETSLRSNKEEQFKTQIGKNKITNTIISNFETKLKGGNGTQIQYSNLGELILFDLFDVTIKLDVFTLCQVYLFESNIIILDNKGTQLLLNQEISTEVFISSIYEKDDDLIINLNSIKVSSIVLASSNKLLKHKWYSILNKFAKKIPVSDINIPLIQVSTNAWNLISDDNELYNDAIPEDILVVNQLMSKGLDLPSKFLKRQILRPDSMPKVLILALPLINCEDYGLENFEYAEALKRIITITLSSLNSADKLGIVFLGTHIKKLSVIGNYYGCASKEWEGWHTVLESLTEDVIKEEDGSGENIDWKEELMYIDLLAGIGFQKRQKDVCLKQIICVTNEILGESHIISPTETIKSSDSGNPFVEARGPYCHGVNLSIRGLCEKYNANFDFVLLADEFRFEPYQIMNMRRYIKGNSFDDQTKQSLEEYNNKIKLHIALDFENLSELLNSKINDLHKVTIRNLETCVKFPDNVKLVSFESSMGEITQSLQSADNSYKIKLNNLPSGYEKSLLFKLDIDLSNNRSNDKFKTNIANSTTKFFAENMEMNFDSTASIRLIKDDVTLNNSVTLNINLERPLQADDSTEESYQQNETSAERRESDLSLAIVSKLSSVSDAYYIKRHIELLVLKSLLSLVLNVKYFDSTAKENARVEFMKLKDTVWELANSCNSSNTNNMGSNLIQSWSEQLIEKIEEIIDGYSLRNYQLSNMKCVTLYLELE